jgi:hypothetical protein
MDGGRGEPGQEVLQKVIVPSIPSVGRPFEGIQRAPQKSIVSELVEVVAIANSEHSKSAVNLFRRSFLTH